eukprot:1195539-Prorocentrum_minimum.AAC.2
MPCPHGRTASPCCAASIACPPASRRRGSPARTPEANPVANNSRIRTIYYQYVLKSLRCHAWVARCRWCSSMLYGIKGF